MKRQTDKKIFMTTPINIVGTIQILVLIILLGNLFTPLGEILMSSDDFERTETDYAFATEGIQIKSGAYTVKVHYAVSDEPSQVGRIDEIIGNISFQAYTCPAALHASSIALNSQASVIEETIWIDWGSKITDFRVCVDQYDKKEFEVVSLRILESRLYRIIRLLGVLLLFAVLDIGYLFFFSNLFSSSRESKMEMFILSTIFVFSSILLVSNVVYYGHDLDFHINRIVSIANGLKEGQFPVRMHSDMLNGYGYPTSLFYGETFLYIPAILYLCKVPLGTCYQIYILFNNVLTILFTYVCFKTITCRRRYALLGVFLYTLAPYRIINIYSRAAVGEYTAMTFLPLIVLGFWNVMTEEKLTLSKYIPLCVGISGVVQSHVITTEMIIIFMVLTCMICIRRVAQPKRFIAFVKAAVVTVLINLWFVIPLLDSMSMDISSKLRTERIQEQGLYPLQWISMFFAGTGMAVKNSMQSEIGLPLGVSFLVGILIAAYVCNIRKKEEQGSAEFSCMKICLVLGTVAMILTSRFFPWDTLASRSSLIEKVFCVIQYPWRYLVIASICFTVSTVLAVKLFEKNHSKIYGGYVISMIVFLNVISISYYYQDFSHNSDSFEILSEQNRNVMQTGNQEYLLSGTDVQQLTSRKIGTNDSIWARELKKEKGKYIFEVKNGSDCVKNITLPVLHYDNYRVYDSNTGEMIETRTGENNCIAVEIPPGYEGKVMVQYHPRAIWRICEIVSVATVILLIGYYACRDIKRRKLLNRCE